MLKQLRFEPVLAGGRAVSAMRTRCAAAVVASHFARCRYELSAALVTVVTATAAAVYAAILLPHTLHAAVARCRHAAPVATAAAAPVATVFAATSLQTRLIPHDLPEDSERKYSFFSASGRRKSKFWAEPPLSYTACKSP